LYCLCISCHHYAEIKPLRKGRKLRCSACGSGVARVVRVIKASMLNGGQAPEIMAKLSTHAGLISIAANRGYKKGWAAVKYKAIYGAWPDGDPPPQNPSQELLWWIKKGNAAYAKARRALEGDKPKPVERGSGLMSEADYDVDL
jgi:hypothetical protein